MKKTCTKCGEEKELNCFNKHAGCKYGVHSQCKECGKKYRQLNKQKIKEQKKKHYIENQEYYIECARKRRKTKEYQEVRKKYQNKNRKRLTEKHYEYVQKNKEKVNKYNNDLRKKHKKEDPLFKLSCAIRTNISLHIKRNGYSKKSKTVQILGCSYEEFKRHLESQFEEGMTWDNYGRNGWHIDHIYPVSKAKDERHLIELNHYTNLQPLWEKDNLSKGNKIL